MKMPNFTDGQRWFSRFINFKWNRAQKLLGVQKATYWYFVYGWSLTKSSFLKILLKIMEKDAVLLISPPPLLVAFCHFGPYTPSLHINDVIYGCLVPRLSAKGDECVRGHPNMISNLSGLLLTYLLNHIQFFP